MQKSLAGSRQRQNYLKFVSEGNHRNDVATATNLSDSPAEFFMKFKNRPGQQLYIANAVPGHMKWDEKSSELLVMAGHATMCSAVL